LHGRLINVSACNRFGAAEADNTTAAFIGALFYIAARIKSFYEASS
jgi:hypothetical protein